jgi:sulfur carrier protein
MPAEGKAQPFRPSVSSPFSDYLNKNASFGCMEISINSKTIELPDNAGILEALQNVQINNSNGIAIAVNNQVVPRSDWTDLKLKDGDKITLIRATQGG